jgi:hypothetical protein
VLDRWIVPTDSVAPAHLASTAPPHRNVCNWPRSKTMSGAPRKERKTGSLPPRPPAPYVVRDVQRWCCVAAVLQELCGARWRGANRTLWTLTARVIVQANRGEDHAGWVRRSAAFDRQALGGNDDRQARALHTAASTTERIKQSGGSASLPSAVTSTYPPASSAVGQHHASYSTSTSSPSAGATPHPSMCTRAPFCTGAPARCLWPHHEPLSVRTHQTLRPFHSKSMMAVYDVRGGLIASEQQVRGAHSQGAEARWDD